jgi:hypothetical protein
MVHPTWMIVMEPLKANRRECRTILRVVWLGFIFAGVGIGSYLFGLYSYPRGLWPANVLRGLGDSVRTVGLCDDYGRLVAYPGKIQLACPAQAERTGVLLAIGQSNVPNHAATRVIARHGSRVLSFFDGKCHITSSLGHRSPRTGSHLAASLWPALRFRSVSPRAGQSGRARPPGTE